MYPMKAEDMDREKIEQALAEMEKADLRFPDTARRHVTAARALLQAALDEADAIPEPNPYDVIAQARDLCIRRTVQRHIHDRPTEAFFTGRCVEAWERAQEALGKALSAEASYHDDVDAAAIVDAPVPA